MLKPSVLILSAVLCCSTAAIAAEDVQSSGASTYCFIGNRTGSQPGSLERGWVCIALASPQDAPRDARHFASDSHLFEDPDVER